MSPGNKNILSDWLEWQFVEMPLFLFSVWKNYINFALNFFSLTELLGSFFAPWRRYRWRYPNILQFGEFMSTFISNSFSRIIGAMLRLVLIAAGIVFQVFVLACGAAAIFAWLALPAAAVFCIIYIFIY